LPASNRYETDYNLSTRICTLKINNAQKNDLGNYLVLAENKAGRDQTFCKIYIDLLPNVDETPLINPDAFRFLEAPQARQPSYDKNDDRNRYYPPRVIIPLSNIRIVEGDSAVLACKIDGYPKPKVCLKFKPCFFRN
jgi:hypothetical protein